MLYLTGIIITFFLAVILLGKKDKSEADKILAIWLLFIGLHLTLFYTYVSNNYRQYPYLLGLDLLLPLVHGPFLYLYTASLTGQSVRIRYQFLHFLPFILSFFLFIDFFVSPYRNKINVYSHHGEGYETQLGITHIAFTFSGIIYIVLSLILLQKHKRNIVHQFSKLERINLVWLRYLIAGIGVIWLIIIVVENDKYTFGAVVAYVLFIGYYGIRQAGIFTAQPHMIYLNPSQTLSGTETIVPDGFNANSVTEILHVPVKYTKSGVNTELAQEIHQALVRLMENEKLYRNAELNLAELAHRLGVHVNVLSQVINSQEQKNFYDYINSLRIEEFKELAAIPANQKFTILALAFECGFNSKTSFNRNFKKFTGSSPKDYIVKKI